MGTLSPFPRRAPLTVMDRLGQLMADEHVLFINNRHARLLLSINQVTGLRLTLERHDEVLVTVIDWLLQRARFLEEGTRTGLSSPHRPRMAERVETAVHAPDIAANLLADHEFLIQRLIRDHAECEKGFRDATTAGLVLKVLDLHMDMAANLRHRLR